MGDFITCNADLHLHGLYSGGVSSKMVPMVLGEQAPLKGISLLGTADILNARWIKLVKEQLKPSGDGLLRHDNGTKFILQAEIEDDSRVHHMILFPDFSKVYEMREAFRDKCKDLDTDGRPKIRMGAEEIAELCNEAGCLIGFCHAFTPYFGLLALFDSYRECYGSQWKTVSFMELGLSADTDMADRISELHELTFLSNSDAHSPWPNKMGREFNRLLLKDVGFSEVAMALKRENGRRCVLNAGFNPLEGKYHRTRCRGCLAFFGPQNAARLGWRCPECGKTIKKGVDYRIDELSDLPPGKHPLHRPRYVHTIPLSEIIALAIGVKAATSDKVQSLWQGFVDRFGSEIDVLLKVDTALLAKLDAKVAEFVGHFRDEKIGYVPGGAGVYGKLLPPGEKTEIRTYREQQKNLADF